MQCVAAGLVSINGFDILELHKTVALGQKMIEFRATNTAVAISKAINQA